VSSVNWPSGLSPASIELGIKFNTQVSVSDLSGYVQTVELPGARWSMSLSMAPLKRDGESSEMEAFIAKLRGQAVRAVMPVFNRTSPRGLWAGTPAVNNNLSGSPSISQTGTSLVVSGFTAFTTVKEGDYFNLGSSGQLLMITEDATADSSGVATLSFQPAIRTAPTHGTLLVSTNPVVPLMVLTDPHAKWRIRPGDMNDFSLDLIEVFV
jgi:hypothetical protein